MASTGGFIMTTMDSGLDGLRAGVRKMVDQTRRNKKPIFPAFIRKEKSTDWFMEFGEMGGFGELPRQDEGDGLNFAKPDNGNITRFQPERRQLAFVITAFDKQYNKIDKVARASSALAIACKRTQERIATLPFNLGWSSARKGHDNQPLYSVSHTRFNGQTVVNTFGTMADLTIDSLESAIVNLTSTVGQDGTFEEFVPKVLLVHTSNEPNAFRVVKNTMYFANNSGANAATDATGLPVAAASGARNDFVSKFGLTIVASPYLTDVDAWFLNCDPDEIGVIVVENMAMRDRSYVEPETENFVYSVDFVWTAGHYSDMGTFASQGY